jgi:hypothetical protein
MVNPTAATAPEIPDSRRQHPPCSRWRASCSRRVKRDVEELHGRFSVLEAFGNNSERKCLNASYRFITILPVAQHAGQGGNLGDPATIFFAFELDRERHVRNVPLRPGTHQLSLLWSPSPKQLGERGGEQGSARGVPPTGPVSWLADAAAPGGIDPLNHSITETTSVSCRGRRAGGAHCRPRTCRRQRRAQTQERGVSDHEI